MKTALSYHTCHSWLECFMHKLYRLFTDGICGWLLTVIVVCLCSLWGSGGFNPWSLCIPQIIIGHCCSWIPSLTKLKCCSSELIFLRARCVELGVSVCTCVHSFWCFNDITWADRGSRKWEWCVMCHSLHLHLIYFLNIYFVPCLVIIYPFRLTQWSV